MADSPEAVSSAEGEFGLLGVLTFSAHDISSFWHMWSAILLWMTVSYILVHVMAFLWAVIMLRNHPWMVFLSFPFLGKLFTVIVNLLLLFSHGISRSFDVWSFDKCLNSLDLRLSE